MRLQRRKGHLRWCNCLFYVTWHEKVRGVSFEDAFQAWFDAISDKRSAKRYNFASEEWELRCSIPERCGTYATLDCSDVERGPAP